MNNRNNREHTNGGKGRTIETTENTQTGVKERTIETTENTQTGERNEQ
jgi:hypothetical protein